MSTPAPAAEPILASLKPFQRDTVEHAYHRLWVADDQVKRFLVADEVGLGKTMVAKGVIAKTVEHLWNSGKRIDIVYICSNGQIAQQNLSRLNVVGASELRHADRLTLLPAVINDMRNQAINFVSFTPGTSFSVGQKGGKFQERVLLYWMLTTAWGRAATRPTRWRRFFEGGMSRENFQWEIDNFDHSTLDEEFCTDFAAALAASQGPRGGPLLSELLDCVQEFNYLRGNPSQELSTRRFALIGAMRHLVARAAVQHLEPDLVILDEFQRFKDILDDPEDPGAELAREIFNHPDAKTLLLSATPYKMYTLPDEPDGEDHYQDFTRTVRFLAGTTRADAVENDLRTMRESLLSGQDQDAGRAARDRVQHQLRRVMSRTERLAATPERDGMLQPKELPGVRLAAEDVRAWCTFNDVARRIEARDVFEYWRSTPYPLSLMERGSYQVRTKFRAAVERGDAELTRLLRGRHGFLNWRDIRDYKQVDPGNAKLRGLMADVLDSGAWKLAWLAPSLPYYQLDGVYADPRLQGFTKRLIFSAWAVVPKAITAMVSYEAERRAIEGSAYAGRDYDGAPIRSLLRFSMADGDRAAAMPALALIFPFVQLAQLGDPLAIARSDGAGLTLEEVHQRVRRRVETALADLPAGHQEGLVADQRWYWAAPFLLDEKLLGAQAREFLAQLRRQGNGDQEDDSALVEHIAQAMRVGDLELGRRPDDLAQVLASMAIAGPGVCALRALGRACGGPDAWSRADLREQAYRVGHGLRSLFSKAPIMALVHSGSEDAYWRRVLTYSLHGCLQSVLDEYVHVLIDAEGLQLADAQVRAGRLAAAMVAGLATRTAVNTVTDVTTDGGQAELTEHRVRSYMAARFGRVQTDDKAVIREQAVRAAYNSPFRPFVLASTSVGQEGLDFHTYSHAVVHWNLPSNPVDLEQREGRVHRYKGHAVRRNVATEYADAAFASEAHDPWQAVFDAATADSEDSSGIRPFWVFTRPGGAVIERYVPTMPLSQEVGKYERLKRTVAAYRMVIGQPRQDDLMGYVGQDVDWLQIDLTPPGEAG